MIRRREFIAGLGGAAACAVTARAQEPERVRRLGVLLLSAEEDPISLTRLASLREGLDKAGWSEGRNLKIDYRFGASDPARPT
jgi:putative ABC transport system substrate-binding protein